MQSLFWFLVTVLMMAFSLATRPASHTCPAGWYINGVHPDGVFEARPWLGDPDRAIEDARARREWDDERAYRGRIYCTGGAHPVLIGFRTVGCQR